jgi:tetratricopeptide (TPR) repeat protein
VCVCARAQTLLAQRHEHKERLWRIAGIFHGYNDFEPALEWYERALKYWGNFSYLYFLYFYFEPALEWFEGALKYWGNFFIYFLF